MRTLGERIKYRRMVMGITADQLADRLGKNRATIYRYESDDIGNVPISVIEQLADILGTTAPYLAGWVEEEDQRTKTYKENVTHILDVSSREDLDASAVNIQLIREIIEGKFPLTFSNACWIADELGYSLDYLAGLEKPGTQKSTELDKIKEEFISLNPENRTKLLELAHLYLDAQRKTQ